MGRMTDTRPPDPAASLAERVLVEVGDFRGSVQELLLAVLRGDLDLRELPIAEVTGQVGRHLAEQQPGGDLREAAETLSLLARLVSLKAARLVDLEPEEEPAPEDEAPRPGDRLAEYRLFRAAMEALLLEPAETGARSFLSLVSPEVLPRERLRIPPERLAAAFREVLERLADRLPLPVGTVTFSVEEKAGWLRELLGRGPVDFEVIFAEVETRLEAVACFLGLLELIRRGEAVVDQPDAFGPIRVQAGG
jgi:chromatin segregation and condensation protein Rec8/ScpA/Scc1 (kleisin family)